ncbi:MAG: PAS domain-containing protein [Clostridia bacterium]|nr:PAS domain-containing protein [Clostridia bacterium]
MNFPLENISEILDKQISGFRQYKLAETILPIFVSQNLCDMTGYSKKELLSDSSDLYAGLIHPADRHIYDNLLNQISTEKTSNSAEYRIIKKDGSTLYVRDTMTVEKQKNDTWVAYSVLTDITALKSENDNLRFLNETVPCGMLKYSCEKNPKVTYINNQMMKMLRMPKPRRGEVDYLEFYKDNIYLMIPVEDRRKFSRFLNKVYLSGAPVAGEMNVLRCDGTKARLFGWVTKVKAADGKEEFQSVCMDITEQYHAKRTNETELYLKALSDVYEKIFEYDFVNGTVKYISGGSDTFGRIRNLPMHMEEATSQWIEHAVYHKDRTHMHDFFANIYSRRVTRSGSRPPQIQYRAITSSGEIKKYVGIFLKINDSVNLFCCKQIIDEQEIDELRNENLALRNMQEFVTRFTEGVMAFKIENNNVKPLYASDNVCNFFGYTKEEWFAMAEKSCSIKEFISQSSIAYEDVKMLFSTGEAEFTYFDMKKNKKRLIKAICSQKNYDGNSSCYVMLYNVDNGNETSSDIVEEYSQIYIRTFGYFDVFVNNKPIAFRNKKAKELLALLVDRRGGYVTSEEAIGYLWENEPANAVTLARYRKEALRLKNTLEEYGITDIIESVDGKRRIIPEKIKCDLYDYLSGQEEYAGLFKGSYLNNYAWGEITLGELMNESMN